MKASTRTQIALDMVAMNHELRRRFPRLSDALLALGESVAEIEVAMEGEDNQTRRIFNDEVFEEAALRNLWAAIAKGATGQ